MSREMFRIIHIIFILLATCFLISCSGDTTADSQSTVSKPDSDSQTIIDNPDVEPTYDPEKLKQLEDAHNKNPLDYSVAFMLIQEYENQRMIDEAMIVLEDYIKGDDLAIAERARFDQALLMAAYKDKDKAYQDILDIAQNGSEILSSEAYFQLGNMISVDNYSPPDGDKTELSIKYYKKAAENEPGNALLYRRLADLLYSEGDLDEAREYLAIFLVVYPDDYFSWLDLADWSVEADDLERAKEYYRRASASSNEEIKNRVKAGFGKLE